MKEAPLLPWEGSHRGAARNTEAETQQPTFSRLYLKGTAKPTLDTAFSLLSIEIKRLNTTKADSLKGYIQTQVWVLLFFFFYIFVFFLFLISLFLKDKLVYWKRGGGIKTKTT